MDNAEDGDIIMHEYAHACLNNLRPNIFRGTNEIRSINEAFADFFACHYFSDESEASGFNPAIFAEWYASGTNNTPDGLRRLDLDLKYPR